MFVLGIDSTTSICSVSLWRDGQKVSSKQEVIERGHASLLPILFKRVLDESKLEPDDIDKIVVNRGPGTFTGIRISLSFALGLSFALNKPILAVNGFEVLSKRLENGESGLLVINGGRPDRYVQGYKDGIASSPSIMSLNEIESYNLQIIGLEDDSSGADALLHAFYNGALTEEPTPFYLRPPDVTISNKTI